MRLTFRETGDQLEGLAPADESFLEALTVDAGLYLLPPDARTNTQKIYIPRAAIAEMQMLGVISSPSRRGATVLRAAAEASSASVQETLFEGVPAPTMKRGKHGRS